MADIETSARTFLRQNAAVLAAFGERIYIDKVPDKIGDNTVYPFAKISTVLDPPTYTQDGESTRLTLLQIDVYDKEVLDCKTNSELIRAAFTGYRGLMGEIEVGRVFVRNFSGNWQPDARHVRRINEIEIGWTVQ
jgi:hypothetical protein